MYCSVLHNMIWYYIILYYNIIQYYIILYYIILYHRHAPQDPTTTRTATGWSTPSTWTTMATALTTTYIYIYIYTYTYVIYIYIYICIYIYIRLHALYIHIYCVYIHIMRVCIYTYISIYTYSSNQRIYLLAALTLSLSAVFLPADKEHWCMSRYLDAYILTQLMHLCTHIHTRTPTPFRVNATRICIGCVCIQALSCPCTCMSVLVHFWAETHVLIPMHASAQISSGLGRCLQTHTILLDLDIVRTYPPTQPLHSYTCSSNQRNRGTARFAHSRIGHRGTILRLTAPRPCKARRTRTTPSPWTTRRIPTPTATASGTALTRTGGPWGFAPVSRDLAAKSQSLVLRALKSNALCDHKGVSFGYWVILVLAAAAAPATTGYYCCVQQQQQRRRRRQQQQHDIGIQSYTVWSF